MRSVFPYLLIIMVLLSGCASLTSESDAELAADAVASPQAKPTPSRPFPEDTFFDLLVAEMALRYHDLDTALDNYSYQADKTGDHGVITTAARLAQYLNRDDVAETYAQQWLQFEPENAEAHYILASALSHGQRPLDAFPHMTKVMELGGESNFAALAATVLARDKNEQGNFLALLNTQLERHPDENSLKIAKALILQYQEQEVAALALIQQVLNDEPDNPHALLIETRTLAQLGRDDEALERLRYAIDQNPNHKRLRHDLARRLVKTDLFQAKAQYELLVRQNPDDSDLLLELMLVNRELSNTDEAAQQLESLSDTPAHSSRAHYVLGRLAEEDRKWPEAIGHYEKATASPEFTPASQRLTSISLGIDGAEKTLARLQALRLRLPEHSGRIYLLEAEVLRKETQYQRGYDLLSSALSANPNDEQLRYARSLFSERLGNLAGVETDLRHIIARDPENATALNALGYSLANLSSRLDEAETLVKRALVLEPEDPAIIDSYGWILFLKGNTGGAIKLLEKAYSKSQDHEIAAHFGEALWASGDKQRAKTVWETGLKHTPDSPIIYDTLRRLGLFNE
ncbi:MAG: tetratricopeptide repeat protein [Zhongshania sp.]|uniref:tetratricopeptide repeat protein n=1 Tax=Zhongshania sp. TaxID=1971902 RepID=UPI002615DD6E|nr:tetratricopeptide repeat protein [Zhongshania sp.]MDF1693064.1 tetratricopeptide repeat protein [Zhongshania sp.]